MKIASIVGARPEFVQAAAVSTALRKQHEEILIHTGQHYDDLMSDVFFRELKLPIPDINLNIGSRSPAAQVGETLTRLEPLLNELEPDLVVVRGDTNSTLAGALAAKQGLFALAHIEAGMRSFDLTMPEEQNRVVTDHLADVLFAVDEEGEHQLTGEKVSGKIFSVGDVLFDTYSKIINSVPLQDEQFLGHRPGAFDLLTIHRSENTDDPVRLETLLSGLKDAPRPIIFPIHPRTRKRIVEFNLQVPPRVALLEPFSYLQMLQAERQANRILTDSGGVQREAYFSSVQCITLRETTEWKNTIRAGWNSLASTSDQICKGLLADIDKTKPHPPLFGDGHASAKIAEVLESSAIQELISSLRRVRHNRRK